jgi:hypothetical protein
MKHKIRYSIKELQDLLGYSTPAGAQRALVSAGVIGRKQGKRIWYYIADMMVDAPMFYNSLLDVIERSDN